MDERLDYNKVKTYLESLASYCTEIDNFVGYNEQELHDKLNTKRGIQGKLLTIFKYEGVLNGNDQRTLAGRVIHFGIVQSISKADDYALESSTIADCERVGFKVLSRIYYDSKKPDSQWLYKNFDQNNVEFNEIRLKSSLGLVGMEFSLTLKTKQPLTIDVNDWSDIDSL
ncbi:hypothetical protein [Aquimarina algiphila]|uniref:Uncharacterized protein n=1 Tax=Aquimarina algiphila TaxID=2047982 RepID=A0A554VAE5_9FLAO|nr:hypothetical protein [Aquimarina algiphila]TSE02925.1 hypothetical protein FOF46_30325 [Aquimarina algiphila]